MFRAAALCTAYPVCKNFLHVRAEQCTAAETVNDCLQKLQQTGKQTAELEQQLQAAHCKNAQLEQCESDAQASAASSAQLAETLRDVFKVSCWPVAAQQVRVTSCVSRKGAARAVAAYRPSTHDRAGPGMASKQLTWTGTCMQEREAGLLNELTRQRRARRAACAWPSVGRTSLRCAAGRSLCVQGPFPAQRDQQDAQR